MVDSLRAKVSRLLTWDVVTQKDSVRSWLRQSNTFYLLHFTSFSLATQPSTFSGGFVSCWSILNSGAPTCVTLFSGNAYVTANPLHCVRFHSRGFGQIFGREVCYSVECATKLFKDLMSGTRATYFFKHFAAAVFQNVKY